MQAGVCVPFPTIEFAIPKSKPIERRTQTRRKIEISEPLPARKDEELLEAADPELRSYLKAAEEALRTNDPDRAEKIFAAAANRFPKDLRPSLGISRCLFIKGEEQKAIRVMNSLKSKYPLAGEPYAMLGNIFLSQGKFEDAKKNLEIAVQLEHGDSQAYFQLAQIYTIYGDYDQSTNLLRESLRADSNNRQARVLLAHLFWSKGRLEQALQEISETLSDDHANSQLLREQAMLLWANGKIHDAIEKLHEAYRTDPENAEIQKQLLTIYGKRRDWPNAYDAALSWAQLEPENAMARAIKGWCALRTQEFDESLSSFKEAVKLAPNNAEIHNLYGLALIERRKFDDALSQYNAAIAIDPEFLPAILNKAYVLNLKGRQVEALSELSQAELKFPNEISVLNMHSNIFLKTADFEHAEQTNKRALAIDAHDPFALICQGILLREQGKLSESAAILQRASRFAPDSATPLYELSSTLLKQGKGKQAIEMAQQSLQIAPSNLEAKANLAFALAYEKNYDGPITLLKECIVRNPKELSLRMALANIEQAKGELEDSRITLEKAHTLFPDAASPVVGLAKIETANRNYKKAIDLLEQAQVCAPQDSSISILLAKNYFSLGKTSACINQLSTLEEDQLSADDLHMRAICEYTLKNFDDAALDYAKLEKRSPLLMGSTDMLNFARSLLEAGQIARANEVLSKLESDSSLAKQCKQAVLERLRADLKHALARNNSSQSREAAPR